MKRLLGSGWRRMVVAAGALLALAAVVVVVAGALLPATPTPSPTVIAVNGPPVPQSTTASSAPATGTPAVADAPGTVREGFVIVDQADHARLGPAGAGSTIPVAGRPLATGPLTGLDVSRVLVLWPLLLTLSLVAVAAAARRAERGAEGGAA